MLSVTIGEIFRRMVGQCCNWQLIGIGPMNNTDLAGLHTVQGLLVFHIEFD
jgi:hypothetical protein